MRRTTSLKSLRFNRTPAARFASLAKTERLVVGLMSGTSADGVDACLVGFSGFPPARSWNLLEFVHVPYPDSLQSRILSVSGGGGSVEELCRLDFELGRCFACAVGLLLDKARLSFDKVDFIASHGQTVRHLPPREGFNGATLQIGKAAVICEETGLPVISDFRSADVAAGGEGAPLVPVADAELFTCEDTDTAIVNIGGMANITVLPSRSSGKAPLAFDTGPGNALIDAAVRLVSREMERMDRDGRRAARGRVNVKLLAVLLEHPFLDRRPPKSTGREEFGSDCLERALSACPVNGDDIVATVTAFTSRTIADAVRKFVPAGASPSVLFVAGGGCRNPTLMKMLETDCAPVEVKVLGDGDHLLAGAREALCFALLGDETLLGRPGAMPSVTGAEHGAVLGVLAFPPGWCEGNVGK